MKLAFFLPIVMASAALAEESVAVSGGIARPSSAAAQDTAALTVSSDTVGLVQFASWDAVSRHRDDTDPGRLVATESKDDAGDAVAYLTVGAPDGQRIPVADPYALRFTRIHTVGPEDYSIVCSDEAFISATDTVTFFTNCVFGGENANASGPPSPESNQRTVRRTAVLKPNNGKSLVSCHVERIESSTLAGGSLMNNNFCKISATPVDGMIYIEATVPVRDTVTLLLTHLRARITEVYATDAMQSGSRGAVDLSAGAISAGVTGQDFFFYDRLGTRTSLGALRPWVQQLVKNNLGEDWWRYGASGLVNLRSNTLRYSSKQFEKVDSVADAGDTVTRYAGGEVALRIGAPNSSTNTSFAIVGIECAPPADPNHDYVYVTPGTTNLTVLTCHDLKTTEWQEAPGAEAVYGVTYKGESADLVRIPVDGSTRRFYKAKGKFVGDGGDASGYVMTTFPVYAGGGICLQSPNGTWWRLTVNNSGALTTVQVSTNDVPAGVGMK